MSGLAAIAARVAPDYARMLALLTGAILPEADAFDGESHLPEQAQPDGTSGAWNTSVLLPRAPEPEMALAATTSVGGRMALASGGGDAAPADGGGAAGIQQKVAAIGAEAETKAVGAANMATGMGHATPAVAPGRDRNAAHTSAAFVPVPAGSRLRLGAGSAAGRGHAPRPGAAAAAGQSLAGDAVALISEPGRFRTVGGAPGAVSRLAQARSQQARPLAPHAGPGAAGVSALGLARLTVVWTAPDLMAPRGWPAAAAPGADPFAEAALEDALGDLLERTALAGGIDL